MISKSVDKSRTDSEHCITKMKHFFRCKPNWIGLVDQVVKTHYRKLRINPLYNSVTVAHWALQAGEYMYEVAAPADAILAQSITLEIREGIRQKALQGDEDYDEDEMLENLLSKHYDEDPAFEEEDRFAKGMEDPYIMPGKNWWNVPL